MRLVICEKGELARDIARALGAKVSGRPPYKGAGWSVCACSGHLLSLVEPADVDGRYAKWREEDLPIYIDPWPLAPEGKRSKELLDIIAGELSQNPEEIYHAGDADDEGQLIVDEVLEHLGHDPADARVKRVYVNDNIERNIVAAFEEARPNAECVGAGKAASARRVADMVFGVNESRLATLKLGEPLALGRVQTPTLGLVVECDLARENHVSREYYQLEAVASPSGLTFKCKPAKEHLEDGKRCFDKDYLGHVAGEAQGAKVSFDVKHADKQLFAPLPYNMTTLVADMSKRHGMSMKQVMEATQSLRDKHRAITYNRSTCCYLKEEHFTQAPQVAECVMRSLGEELPIDTSRRSKAFDDSKVEAHHGIIPQERVVDASSMTPAEARVYEAVALRYLAQFMAPAVYVEQTASFALSGCVFEHRSNHMAEPGWTAEAPAAWCSASFSAAPPVEEGRREGESLDCMEVEAKKTSPPKAWTDGTLMVAMANAQRYVADPEIKRVLKEKDKGFADESGGIGTVATRAQVIESLVGHGYLERSRGKISSTELGRSFYALVPEQLKGIDLTARWWLMQQQVAQGEASEQIVAESVLEEFGRHRDSAYEGKSVARSVGACPRCGAAVVARGKVYTCSSNRSRKDDAGEWELVSGCGFKMMPVCGKTLTEAQAKSVLMGKQPKLSGLRKRDGGTFSAKVALDADSDFGCRLVFEEKPKGTKGKKIG